MNDKDLERVLQESNLVIGKMQEMIAELQQKNATWELVSNSDDLIDMSEVAKVLNFKGYGRNKLFEFLRDSEILRYNNQPYQSYVDRGYFKIIEQKIDLPNGEVVINLKTVVTQKGLDYVRKLLDAID